MFRKRHNVFLTIFAPLLILTLSFGLSAEAPIKASLQRPENPTYNVPIPGSAQAVIQTLAEENSFSYELILAIFSIDALADFTTPRIREEIESLLFIRNYWEEEGYSSETVYFLILLSRQRGIEGCLLFMATNDSADNDQYVQDVTQLKYLLEQGLDPLDTLDLEINPGVY